MFLLVTHSTAVPSHPPLLFPSRIHIFHPLSLFLLAAFLYIALTSSYLSIFGTRE